MAEINNANDTTCWWAHGEGDPLLIASGSVNWYSPCGSHDGGSPERLKLPQDPAIALLGIDPKNSPSFYKDTCSSMFIAVQVIIAGIGNSHI